MLEHRVIEMMAEERIGQAREQAARDRWVRDNLPHSIPWRQRLAVALAARLIAAGTLIQQHYEPIRYAEPETDCSPC